MSLNRLHPSPRWFSRRHLLIWGAATTAGASTLSAANAQTPPAATTRPDGFEPVVGPEKILADTGKVLTDKVLIVKNTSTQELVGVSPFCPHRNCVVDWEQSEQVFVCPCHGSKFDVDGKVTKGPAEKPLTAYEVKVEENQFLIKAKV